MKNVGSIESAHTFPEEPFVDALVLTAEYSESMLVVVDPGALVGVASTVVYAMAVSGVEMKVAWWG